MFFESFGMGWFKLLWFGSTWIESELFFQFRIELVWFQFTECFASKIFTLKLFFALHIFVKFVASKVSTMFLLSLFVVPCQGKNLSTQEKITQLLSLVLVIFGYGILMVLDGWIPILSSAFSPKSTFILLPLFRLPKWNSQSLFPFLSIEALAWLALVISLLPNRALPMANSFEPIVISNNNGCSILVRLVSFNWSASDMDMKWRVYSV